MNILLCEKICKTYSSGNNQVTALDGIDLTVSKGEFVAIVGASGSGKSTLLHILGSVDKPTSGTVIIDGTDLSKLSPTQAAIFRRRKVGFIDYFKQYNDRFGHISGDQCLRTFAGFMEKEVQNRSGSLIRYGGEEFLVFLFGQDAEEAEEIAEHMRRSVESGGYICDGPGNSPVTVSIGVYKECPSAETLFKEFITLADSALYEAKRCGRNCVKLKTSKLPQQT